MTQPKLAPADAAAKPDHFAELAAELHRCADDIATLIGSGHPKPRQFQLNIQPGDHKQEDAVTVASVDAMALALLSKPGEVAKMPGGVYFHMLDGRRGPVSVSIYQGVSTEWALAHDVAAAEAELAEREAELEKARARVAELRGARGDTGADFSDLGDRLNPEVVPVPADAEVTPLGHAAQNAEPVTRYFSFGHGQSDPVSGVNLLGHYVTVVAATAEDCREAMFASRFGNRWAFEYIPGTPQADEWIPQWTEHERIDATSLRPGEHGRVTNPDLAQFLAGKEQKRRDAPHCSS